MTTIFKTIIEQVARRKKILVFLTMAGLLGALDVFCNSADKGDNIPFLFLKWFSISFLFAFILSYLLASKNRPIKWVAIIISSIYILLCITNAISYLFWGFGVSCRMFTIIMETNSREVGEFINYTIGNFISNDFLQRLGIFALITAAFIVGIKKISPRAFLFFSLTIAFIGIVFTTIQLCSGTERKNANILIRCALDIPRTLHSMREFNTMQQLSNSQENYFETLQGDSKIDNIVIVIGESASRKHHSIYGYYLPTTPLLEKKKEEIIVFNDVTSSYSTTSESMKMFMTYKNSITNKGEWNRYPNIPNIFSKLGYKSYWISNQEKNSFMGGCESFFSEKCDTSRFVGMLYTGDNLQEKYDDALLPELSNVMKEDSPKKLIILHMMGSHGEYYRRYPKEFALFTEKSIEEAGRKYLTTKKKKLISEYDNSILYSDYIVSNMIDTLKKYDNQKSLLVYFSDHGEEMYDVRDFAGHSTGYVDIPFIIWASNSLHEEMPDKYQAMQESTGKPISIENLTDFLLGISNIQYKYYDPTFDFTSPNYRLEERYADDKPYHKGQCE